MACLLMSAPLFEQKASTARGRSRDVDLDQKVSLIDAAEEGGGG